MLAHLLHSLKGAVERTIDSTFSEALLPNPPQQLLGPFSRETQADVVHLPFHPLLQECHRN